MDIQAVRNHLKEVVLSKDASVIKGDNVIAFVSWPQLRRALEESLPPNVRYETQVKLNSVPVPFNAIQVKVWFKEEVIHEEDLAMPLYENPMDAAGALTMLRKALVLSAFDLVPDEGSQEKLDLDEPALQGLVRLASEQGAPTAIFEGNKRYNMTDAAIKLIRDTVVKKQEAAKAERKKAEEEKHPTQDEGGNKKAPSKSKANGTPTDGAVVQG